jgi:archaellum biogenesis protein FlaJ (TadC family)
MWATIGKILGSGDVIKEGFDLIDSMHTSDAEEIEARANAKVSLIKAYEPFKVAQRYLMLMFSTTFLLCFVIVLGMTLAGKGDVEDVTKVMAEFYIGEIMLAIVVFYFGGGFAEGTVVKIREKL